MTDKEMVLESVRDMPSDATFDSIIKRVRFLAAIQKGLDQIEQGNVLSHDEVKRQLATWLER